MEEKIQFYLDEICQSLFAARRYNALWWELCGDNRPKNVDMMNHYVNLFRGLIGATFDSGIVAICKVVDNRNNTINIYKVFEYLKSSNKFTLEEIDSYKKRLAIHNSAIKGIKILRGNAVGHSSDSLSYLETFRKADIQFNQWKAVIDELINIVCDIYYKQFKIIHNPFFHVAAAKELEVMFKDLMTFHSTK